jgi:DNA-nicking Smr family endonuclease
MRRLRDDEQQLWDRLRETVRPLPGRHSSRKKAASLQPKSPPEASPPSAQKPGKTPKPSSAPATATSAPSLAPFEEKTLRRLSRDLIGIDDKLDLHGMRQERAHSALGAFLRKAQARGNRIVLVVTGKGQEDGQHGRGVLRNVVPMWLAQPELRDFIVGFVEAGRRHGGSGALYVRIRRRREARRPAARA